MVRSGLLGTGKEWGSTTGKFQQLQQPSEAVRRELGIGHLGSACVEGDSGNDFLIRGPHEGSGGIRASFPTTPMYSKGHGPQQFEISGTAQKKIRSVEL